MKNLKSKLVTESLISLFIMMSGIWGITSPFELSFVSPITHMKLSYVAFTFGIMAFIHCLDSYIGNAEILEMKARHENELRKAKTMELSWKGNFKKIQGKYNELKELKHIPNIKGTIAKNATIKLRQAVEYAKYRDWHSDVGNEKAMSICDDFHNGLYGSRDGMYVQIDDAISFLEKLHVRKHTN